MIRLLVFCFLAASLVALGACQRPSASTQDEVQEHYLSVANSVGFDIESQHTDNDSQLWLATYTSQGKTAKFRIELGQAKPIKDKEPLEFNVETGEGRFIAVSGSDPSALPADLKNALEAKAMPARTVRAASYINAFGTDGWRDAISTSVKSNHKYLYPPKPKQPTQSPARPTPSTPVGAGFARRECPAPSTPPIAPGRTTTAHPPSRPPQPHTDKPPTPPPTRPSPADTEAALAIARSIFPDRANAPESQPASRTSRACHRERSEGPCLDPAPSTTGETQLPITPAFPPQSTSNPTPTQSAQTNYAPPAAPLPSQTRREPGAPIREPYAVHFDHTHRLRVDGKPW